MASLVLAASGVTLVAGIQPAGAATFNVTNTNDAGPGSLRQAVLDADAANVDAKIVVDDDLDGDTIHLTTGELNFTPATTTVALELEGNGVVVRQETPANRVLTFNSLGQLTIRDTTIRGGRAATAGGVGSLGPTLIVDSTFVDNVATAGDGGGLFAFGLVTVEHSTFSDNHARDRAGETAGGAIAATAPGQKAISLTDSTISDNSAESSVPVVSLLGGGGLATNGDIEIEDSTIAENTVKGPPAPILGGGGTVSFGSTSARNSTITDNRVSGTGSVGGGVLVAPDALGPLFPLSSPAVELAYTDVVDNSASSGANLAVTPVIVAVAGAADAEHPRDFEHASLFVVDDGATAASGEVDAQEVENDQHRLASFASVITEPGGGGDNCDGFEDTESSGYNYADDGSCDLDEKTDSEHESNDPLLGELADNGGPTETLLPAVDSPLVNAIPNDECDNDDGDGLDEDQRGLPRPGVDDPRCDIGSVELQGEPVAVPVVITPTFTG